MRRPWGRKYSSKMGDFPRSGIRNKQVSDIESGYPDIESGYRIFINCSNLRKVIHTKLDFHWAQIAFNFLEENYAICSHPPSQIYVVWMKLPCRGKYFFRNLWSSRIALRFTVSEWIQSRDWLSSSPGSCGLGKGEGASGTIRMFAAALIPTLEHGFSVAWFQIETKFYFGNHWMENRDFHVTIVQWKCQNYRTTTSPTRLPALTSEVVAPVCCQVPSLSHTALHSLCLGLEYQIIVLQN